MRVRYAKWALTGIAAVLAAWAVWPAARADIRRFDPTAVARLETSMWRAYYDGRRLRLFGDLGELLRTQYGMPRLRSYAAAFHAARAAFVFKDGKSRRDYERALPALGKFYGAIARSSAAPLDSERAARLELEWWISHRERAARLESDLARLQASIYNTAPEAFREHAFYRAEAMRLRDAEAAGDGVSGAEWRRIGEMLRHSWSSLHDAVNAPRKGGGG